jgi:hypothetical protein
VLKTAEPVQELPTPTGKARIWLWVSLALGEVFSAFSYLNLYTWVMPLRPVYAYLQAPT